MQNREERMRRLTLTWTFVALTVFSAGLVSQAPSGHALFEQALAQERVEGNREAIRLYERVAAEFASDRALAARALLQVGLSYEKLGRNDAAGAYERLVRDFADQEDAVNHARARLAALSRPLDAAAKAAAPSTSPARRLVVDWIRSRKVVGSTRKPTRDGRHLIRYNEDPRTLEQVEISTGNVSRLASEGPNPAEAFLQYVGLASELSTDGRRPAAFVKAGKLPSAPGHPPAFERAELRVFEAVRLSMTSRTVQYYPSGPRSPLLTNPVWMPKGDRLLVFRFEGDPRTDMATQQHLWQLWELPLTGAAPRKVGLSPLPKVEGPNYGVTSFTVHSDGKPTRGERS
jgi:hypothetical protein